MIVRSVDASQGQGQAPASYRRQWKPWKRGRNAGKKIMSTWNGIQLSRVGHGTRQSANL